MPEPLLEVKDLKKTYGDKVAVDSVSFTIARGSCFGLLGPNGAGKTTTLEVIEDIIAPTAGEILYRGKPRTASFRTELGIQFQQTALLSFLSVRETLETFRNLYSETMTIAELTDLCHLGDFLHQYNDRISGGQRQRLMMALALVNRPELIFLDEPTTGLDPQARRNLWDVVRKIKAQGRTLVLTTHYMEEAQFLCDAIAIMDHGKIIAGGSPAELVRRHCGGMTVELPRASVNAQLPRLPMTVHEFADRIEIQTTDLDRCLKDLAAADIDLTLLSVRPPNLEDVFLKLTGRQLRD
jgi:ABC-2 type transport system ATP-binding protein